MISTETVEQRTARQLKARGYDAFVERERVYVRNTLGGVFAVFGGDVAYLLIERTGDPAHIYED